jgi:hypothetical protein
MATLPDYDGITSVVACQVPGPNDHDQWRGGDAHQAEEDDGTTGDFRWLADVMVLTTPSDRCSFVRPIHALSPADPPP